LRFVCFVSVVLFFTVFRFVCFLFRHAGWLCFCVLCCGVVYLYQSQGVAVWLG
jgi:hypothetical protein